MKLLLVYIISAVTSMLYSRSILLIPIPNPNNMFAVFEIRGFSRSDYMFVKIIILSRCKDDCKVRAFVMFI